MKETSEKEKIKTIEMRIKIAHVFLLGLFLIAVIYLFLLQIADIKHYKARANNQRYSKSFVRCIGRNDYENLNN